MAPNSSGDCRSVCVSTLNSRSRLSMRPAGISTFWARSAFSTSATVRRNAASLAGSTKIRIEVLRSPKIRRSAAPGNTSIRGLISRFTASDSCNCVCVSDVNANHITGEASASTLAITGSSADSGKRARTRATLSRTSAAPTSGSLVILKVTVMSLRSEREFDVIRLTPSMPDSESSSVLVICDSITSGDAPL